MQLGNPLLQTAEFGAPTGALLKSRSPMERSHMGNKEKEESLPSASAYNVNNSSYSSATFDAEVRSGTFKEESQMRRVDLINVGRSISHKSLNDDTVLTLSFELVLTSYLTFVSFCLTDTELLFLFLNSF